MGIGIGTDIGIGTGTGIAPSYAIMVFICSGQGILHER